MVHTGPNIQLGGLRAGLVSAAYHVGIADILKITPMPPASSEIMIALINLDVRFTVLVITVYLLPSSIPKKRAIVGVDNSMFFIRADVL